MSETPIFDAEVAAEEAQKEAQAADAKAAKAEKAVETAKAAEAEQAAEAAAEVVAVPTISQEAWTAQMTGVHVVVPDQVAAQDYVNNPPERVEFESA